MQVKKAEYLLSLQAKNTMLSMLGPCLHRPASRPKKSNLRLILIKLT